MKTSKKIIIGVTLIAIIALMIVAAVTGGASGTVDCPDCDGSGEIVFDDED